ncbi:hypothetical protein [Citrobacter cronae]|uniref:hypothetical protein n=1 Tax=Citrobacter cronae TaxID=1748967 RepID=UPI001C11CFD3|nr:hypothetical protein [Citrobacter cronae]MBU5385642.1 hypothetical protein [Citrobacter cronae]
MNAHRFIGSILCLLTFFVVFFRLSFLNSYIYLAFIPAALGILVGVNFLFKRGIPLRKNAISYSWILYILIFLFSLTFDFFQKNIDIQSSFTVRIIMIFVLSFLPALYLSNKAVTENINIEKIIAIAFWIQILLFIVMYINLNIKIHLYNLFGMGESVNLWEQNIAARGFGLSGEINFMTPFLMVFYCFFLLPRSISLMIAACVTQIVNSNTAVLAIIIALLCSRIKKRIKIMALLVISVMVYTLGAIMFPRFYDEFIIGGGTRTIDSLIDNHMILLAPLDAFSAFFGFQQNISSTISDLPISSDMGWVIIFNYGGGVFIVLFTLYLLLLSLAAFGKTKLAIIWFAVGVIFNFKGLVFGPNGYMFTSYLFLLLRTFRLNTATSNSVKIIQ